MPTHEPTRLAFVTRDRPAALARAVRSHALDAKRRGRSLHVFVADDSAPFAARRNRRLLAALSAELELDVSYVGSDERRSLVARLLAAGFSDDVAGVFGPVEPAEFGAGASRNVLLLETAGHPVVFSDDDIVFTPTAWADDDRVEEATRLDPTDFWFFDRAGPSPCENDVDLWTEYEAWLGVDARGSIASTKADGARPVAAVLPGLEGDCATGFPAARLLLDGASQDRLLHAPEGYESVAYTGRVRRRVPRTTILTQPFGASAHLAADNRRELPPFAPHGRNEDGVFLALLHAASWTPVSVALPVTLRHERPARRRSSRRRVLAALGTPRANDFVQWVIRIAAAQQGADETTQSRVSSTLQRIATLPAADFDAQLRVWWAGSRLAWLWRIERCLGQALDPPAAWLADVDVLRRRLDDELSACRSGADVPLDAQATRALVRRLVALLQAWPDLRAVARGWGEAGVRVTSCLPCARPARGAARRFA